MKSRSPPTFWFAFWIAAGELAERDAVPAKPEGVDLHVVLLGLAAVARDVDDALHLLELALEDPVLGGLQVLERVALADDAVAEHLADRVPGRELRLQARSAAARTGCG